MAVTTPALTTIFTPAPRCSLLNLSFCDEERCYAKVEADNTPSCYPEVAHDITRGAAENRPVLTYSPGIFCPLGMTTATSIKSLNGVYCCPSNFAYEDQYEDQTLGSCVASLTEGTFLYKSSLIEFGPSQTDLLKSIAFGSRSITWTAPPLVQATVTAILLVAESSPLATNPLSTSQEIIPTSGIANTTHGNSSKSSAIIGADIGVGISIGVVVGLFLSVLLFKRYRRRRIAQKNRRAAISKHHEHGDKPELEGSSGNPNRFMKGELDALAIRAELEGSPGEECGEEGLGFIKPELYGTPGVLGLLGVNLKKKGELEATSNGDVGKPVKHSLLSPVRNDLAVDEGTEPAELEA
ncbi:hypothetical protein F5Y09DRAFT_317194 [Xylaria sp. FL1042]|nr:hypothetical protein F5Y09DRAFT_317194 [Xylaria sp. FL1042]